MSAKTTARKNVQKLTVNDIITAVQGRMGITRIPSNKDTGAVGQYNKWSAEQRAYNEQTVKPFRVNVARETYDAIFGIFGRYGISPEDIMTIDRLMLEGLPYFDKAPEVFATYVKETPNKAVDVETIRVNAVMQAMGVDEATARAILSGATVKA